MPPPLSTSKISLLWRMPGIVGLCLVTACFSLSLAGLFSLPAVLTATLVAAAAVWVLAPSALRGANPEITGNGWWTAAAALAAVLSLFATLPAGELIVGGWDPGVYLQTAAQIVEQGGLLFEHPDVTGMPPERVPILSRDVHTILEPFGGMRIFGDRITPQFYHVYPALMAFFVALAGGIRGAYLVNPLLNGIALLLMYRLAALWTGRRMWGALAALCLLLFPGQLWQAKFSTAELLTQVLLLGGFGCLLRWGQQPEKRHSDAVLASVCLCLAGLTRYDTLLVLWVAVPVLAFTSGLKKYRKGGTYMLLAALPFLGLWFRHQSLAPFYRPLGPAVAVVTAVCLVASLAAAAAGRFAVFHNLLARFRVPFLGLSTLGWWLWTAFNWWIRPSLPDRTNLAADLTRLAEALGLTSQAEALLGPSRYAMIYLQNLFGAPALAVILLAAPLLWWRARDPGRICWALGGLAACLVLTWQPLNDLFMMWVSRRYIPMVVPWLILGLIAGLRELERLIASRPGPPRVLRFVPALLLLPLLAFQLPAASFMARHREWPGATDWFRSVADSIPEDAVLYTDQPGFGSPLRFVWNVSAFELRRRNHDLRERLLDLIRRHPPDSPLFFLTTEDLSSRPEWEPASRHPFRSSIQNHHRYKVPLSTKSRGGDFVLYRFVGTVE